MTRTIPDNRPRALGTACQGRAAETAFWSQGEALLDTGDVAELLKVQPSTIRKWVHMQSIPVVRVGRAVRFRRDEIARWVDERSEKERPAD